MFGAYGNAGDGAHLDALRFIEVPHAFSALRRIDLVDLGSEEDRLVGAFGFAHVAVDAFVGNHQRHGSGIIGRFMSVFLFKRLITLIATFWFAILLILLFSVHLQWFSAGGFPGWSEGILQGLKALLLPAVSLAVVQAAILARITRSAVLEVLREDFVRTARAKGVSRR